MSAYKKEDFSNGVEVRWCPGCGDYAILNALQRVLPLLGLPPEKHVFVSGIGCAGRLPYYMNTYGFHTIHGRALSIATGLKGMRDDLTVWVITGDGDALSIGGNHFLHTLRRNVNVKVLLFNNQVYGLTKGQFSPTSQPGQVTKTSPEGLVQAPINPTALALTAGASFVARSIDKDPQHLAAVLQAAHQHEGLAFIEIYQDCHIFNSGAFDAFSLKNNRQANTLILSAGEPCVFGETANEAIVLQTDEWARGAATDANVVKHDPTQWMHAMRLSQLQFPMFPVPLGIYYQNHRPTFKLVPEQKRTEADLNAWFRSKATWQA